MASKKAGLPIKKAEGSGKVDKPIPVQIVDAMSPKVSPDYEARERKYRAEDALRDLERAEKHRSDKSLMGDVKKLAKEKMEQMKKIC